MFGAISEPVQKTATRLWAAWANATTPPVVASRCPPMIGWESERGGWLSPADRLSLAGPLSAAQAAKQASNGAQRAR